MDNIVTPVLLAVDLERDYGHYQERVIQNSFQIY